MTTPTTWLVTAALWLGCLHQGSWLLAPAGVVLVAAARIVARPRLRLVVVLSGVLLLGSGAAGARVALMAHGPLVALAAEGGRAAMQATVVSDVRESAAGGWYLLRVRSVGGVDVRHRALVRTSEPSDAPPLGTSVELVATARPLEDDDGFAGYLRRLHVVAQVDPVTPVEVVADPPAVIRATSTVRSRVRTATRTRLPDDQAALLAGLVTGDTAGLDDATADAMLAAGLTHLVAVSGANVALVLAGTFGVAAACGLGARGRRRVAVAAVVWFAVLVRGEPSVLRASVMALLVLAAGGLGRGHDARHTLAVAALLLLLADPFLAGQLGFVLSVLATAGVLVAGPAIAERLPGPRPLAILVGATVGAQLGVAPVLATSEGGLPLGAFPANFVAVPAAAIASAVGVLAALAAQVSTALGGLVAVAAHPALSVILWAGRAFAETPALRAEHLVTPAALALVAAAALRRRHPRSAAVALVVTVAAVVGGPWGGAPTVDTLTLTAFDVGQGDAVLVEVPRPGAPARMLVDAGPDPRAALGLLRARGVTRLDAVVVSHPHADHSDGLPAVLAAIPTGALVTGPRPPSDLDDPAMSATAVEVVAAQEGVPVVRLAAGQRFRLGPAAVEVLGPPTDGSLGDEPNDNSLVLRVVWGDGIILLTGDAEEAAQRRLLARPDRLQADLLKVPHHGGNTNAAGFLDAVGAHTAVIGVGANNDYGHPHSDVLADLAGTAIRRTDIDGTVSVGVE